MTDDNGSHCADSQPRPEPEAQRLLANLVAALDRAFISAWQSTAAWDAPLAEARKYLKEHEYE